MEGGFTGIHRGLHRGAGSEFAEYRRYAPGADGRRRRGGQGLPATPRGPPATPRAAESAAVPARPDVVEAVAVTSGGACFGPDGPAALAQALRDRLADGAAVRRRRLWSRPGLVGLVCLLLGAGAILRSRQE